MSIFTACSELGMRGVLVSEKYRGISSDGIRYRGLAKYRGIPSGGTDFQKLSLSHNYFVSSSQILLILCNTLHVDEISSRSSAHIKTPT